MDHDDSNEIKKFECQQCHNLVNILIFKKTHIRFGYICERCWKTYKKRIKEIYSL